MSYMKSCLKFSVLVFVLIFLFGNVISESSTNNQNIDFYYNFVGSQPSGITITKSSYDILFDILLNKGQSFSVNVYHSDLTTRKYYLLSTITISLDNKLNGGIFSKAKFSIKVHDSLTNTTKVFELIEDSQTSIEVNDSQDKLLFMIRILVDEGISYDAEVEGFELYLSNNYIQKLKDKATELGKNAGSGPVNGSSGASLGSASGSSLGNPVSVDDLLKNFSSLALKLAKDIFNL